MRSLWDLKLLLGPLKRAPSLPHSCSHSSHRARRPSRSRGVCVCTRSCSKKVLGINSLVQYFFSLKFLFARLILSTSAQCS